MNRRTIAPEDDEWPTAPLNELPPDDRVERLHLEGRPLAVGAQTIAIVGARRPTVTGCEVAARLGRGLAEAGFGIMSGLAVGIDAIAHRSALEIEGYTIAVLGCGLDVDYPQRNRRLRAAIAERGTVVTELPHDARPAPHHFPLRNRIIAGLSKAVVFVEGGKKSGGRITAQLAFDYNKEVFAVPGSVRNPMAEGPNELIRSSGAALVTEVSHIFENLAPSLVWTGPLDLGVSPRRPIVDENESRVLLFLDDAPVPVDVICDELGMSLGAAALALSRLEVRGFVVRRHAGYEIGVAGVRARRAQVRDEA